ncbi:MAG TPA: hypothetical protein VGL19_20610 [Polyangiaceae bacterium]
MRLVFSSQRSPALLFSALGCALLASACAGSSSGPTGGAGASVGNPDMGEAGSPDAGEEPVPDSLSFTPSQTVMLSPKQTRVLTVTASPPGSFLVRFALIGSSTASAPGDAVLDFSDVPTDADGVARVTLTAPSAPATFSIRASVAGKVQALLGVSVSSLDHTTLRVKPAYNGHRSVTQWTASLHPGMKCSTLVGDPPPDGLRPTTADAGEPLTVEMVPIGVTLAVALRAGHYIGGCADQSPLAEGDGNQVLVYASDRPINLAATQLSFSLGPDNGQPAFSKLLQASESVAESALGGSSGNDVQALLDAMRDATSNANRDTFSAARLSNHWDGALSVAFGRDAATRLRTPADRWMSAGLLHFEAPDAFLAQLGALSDGALLTLSSVAGVAPASAGFPSNFQSTWSADSSDTLLLGTQLNWIPSRLVTSLALAPALLDFPQATSLEDALAQSLDCGLAANVLLENGSTPGSVVYAGCDEACALNLCTQAVAALWTKASDASGTTVATLGLTGTGKADVGDDAAITGLTGGWVGNLVVGPDSAPVSGTLSGVGASN